jgi:hypothetical protein
MKPFQRNSTPNMRNPQTAAAPNKKMNTIPVTWLAVVPLLQPWSTETTQTTNREMAMTASALINMFTSQNGTFSISLFEA